MKNIKITSITRSSDGHKFKIGDTVKDRLTNSLTNFADQTIKVFYMPETVNGDMGIIVGFESGTTAPISTIY